MAPRAPSSVLPEGMSWVMLPDALHRAELERQRREQALQAACEQDLHAALAASMQSAGMPPAASPKARPKPKAVPPKAKVQDQAKIVGPGGRWVDQSGRWRDSNGRFARAPSPAMLREDA